ncbi:hypothetical protein ACG5V6_14965 [Streptomyces chitinivorans]|uniref:HNH endonuclease n=1 Tax=Streptomyces chitinivorans TaxID=1257027 RepID=A0ABW7HUH6_9ACTN|nr:hypothetical protein [Streptomyces chitinivorans]MDH2407183.1 hypothetical protein [Streptomyces chitinivorans]
MKTTTRRRGYGTWHVQRFRRGVLARDSWCAVCGQGRAVYADHWPKTARQLVTDGQDPNDPKHGRGLCRQCRQTTRGVTRW